MSWTVGGGCLCGACRYSLTAVAVPLAYACHCCDCQTQSGSAFTLQAPVPEAWFAVAGGLAQWAREKPDGSVTTTFFCETCLTRLYSMNSARPGMVLLRAGTLDGSDAIAPALHIWIAAKQPWIALPADAETYEGNAPAARVMAVFAPNFA